MRWYSCKNLHHEAPQIHYCHLLLMASPLFLWYLLFSVPFSQPLPVGPQELAIHMTGQRLLHSPVPIFSSRIHSQRTSFVGISWLGGLVRRNVIAPCHLFQPNQPSAMSLATFSAQSFKHYVISNLGWPFSSQVPSLVQLPKAGDRRSPLL